MEAVSVDSIFTALLTLAAGITVIGGAVVVLSKCANPIQRIARLEENGAAIEEEVKAINDERRLVLGGVMLLLEHAETDNAYGKMHDMREAIEQHLISK